MEVLPSAFAHLRPRAYQSENRQPSALARLNEKVIVRRSEPSLSTRVSSPSRATSPAAGPRLLGLCIFLGSLLVGCSNRSAPRTATAPPTAGTTSVARVGTGVPTSPDARPAAIVAEAFRYLVNGLVVPVQPATLIKAAWSAITSEAASEGVKNHPNLALWVPSPTRTS